MSLRYALLLLGCLAAGRTMAQAPAKNEVKPTLPVVVLVGDSIRLSYAPLVAKRLEGRATVVSAEENGGDSANVLKHLDDGIIDHQPTVVHFNAGLHDLRVHPTTGKHQVEPAAYAENLRQIVARLQKETKASLVFANTTPVIDDRYNKPASQSHRHEDDVLAYNAAALAVMHEASVPVHDLHSVIVDAGAEALLDTDGVHFNHTGQARLAEAVADCVLRQLTIVRFPGAPAPEPSEEAARRYATAQTARDAQVPEVYKRFTAPALPVGWVVVPALALRGESSAAPDTGPPPDVPGFVELVLHRSLRSHAPPFAA